MSGNILKGGDYLPVYRVQKPRHGVKRGRMKPTHYKDGESPGQEWNAVESLAIRAMADPKHATMKKAAKVAGVRLKKLKLWTRNPYFMNAVYELATYNFIKHRTRVMKAVIQHAIGGSHQDRVLYFRLIGDIKSGGDKEPRPQKHTHVHQHAYSEMSDDDLDDKIGQGLGALSEDAARHMEDLSRVPPKRKRGDR